ncbi:hypothetical protein AVEN_214391-1 [Araneus ventricosus]|uniref:Endonuclease/exonuclease/phosphatase domain-containing protein n=1 Tax=Araneus ventricosus TaxID=182803 RepID=A0A4Y2UET5_ARAVE|nr:hypothetical protein AVEN_214391-1 [Araneus ventricosus]
MISIGPIEIPRTTRTSSSKEPPVLIKKSIPHYHIPTPKFHFVEATTISLNLVNKDTFTITSIYIPPYTDPTLFTIDLETLIQIGPNPIICGDFNAQHQIWGSPINTTRGKELVRFAQAVGIEILAQLPELDLDIIQQLSSI